MIELICIDVDGTLVGSSGSVHDDVWSAVDRARARGVRLAICSGRPGFGLAREYAARIQPGGWHVFQNGASVVHLDSAVSRSAPLPAAVVDRLVARARETGRVLELYDDDGYAVESTGDRARRHAALLGVPFAPRSFATIEARAVRAQWLIADHEAKAVLGEPNSELTVATSLSPVMPDTVFVNMTARGVDKGSAIRAVAAGYGVPLDRVMMVGDGANDVPAMRVAGVAVAMGNAEPEALAAAAHVVAHVDAGGLVDALALAATL
jgi:Cof subfamily protein (haloacid dehalogenase superfamily)